MRRFLPLAAVLSLGFAPLPFPKMATGDLKGMEGEWRLIRCVMHGRETEPERKVPTGLMRIKGDRLINCFVMECKLTLNEKCSPKAIDATGHRLGTVHHLRGIYTLSRDNFTVCWSYRDRPATFDGVPPLRYLFTFERVRP